MGHLYGFAVGMVLTVVPASLNAQEVGDPQQGSIFARHVCAICHAVEHGQPSSPNPQAPTFDTIAKTPGITEMALYASLRTSHRTMPNLVLKNEDISNIAAYLLSLKDAR
ncbi:MAG: cytochrome C [Phyllobacterium sp.]|uniref:c-type cytochrome n=1 Tax=Phyllobacterium sp. TaxID=1871046 RepID=UPI0030F328D4